MLLHNRQLAVFYCQKRKVKMTVDDQASQAEEFQRNIALQKRQAELPKVGQCYNCGENVKPSANFCDQHCRKDFEIRNR